MKFLNGFDAVVRNFNCSSYIKIAQSEKKLRLLKFGKKCLKILRELHKYHVFFLIFKNCRKGMEKLLENYGKIAVQAI